MKFTYGFLTKTVKGKEYVYFWKYTGTGHKTEVYVGPANTLETRRRTLQIKLEYLQGLQEEIAATIKETQKQLAELPPEKEEKQP